MSDQSLDPLILLGEVIQGGIIAGAACALLPAVPVAMGCALGLAAIHSLKTVAA